MTPRRVAWTATSLHGLVHALMLVFPQIILALGDDLHAGVYDLSRTANVGYLAFGLGALPGGWLADRFGSRKLLLFCAGACAAGAALLASARGLASLCAGMATLGLGASVYHPAGLALLTRDETGRGRLLGIHGVGGNVGEAVAPALAGALAAAAGWRAPYAVGAALAVAALGFVARLPDVRPARREAAGETDRAGLALTVGIAWCMGFAYRGVVTFLPLHASRHLGAGATMATGSVLCSAMLGAGVLSQWLGGKLADRPRPEATFLLVASAALVPLALVAWLGGAGLAAAAIAFGFLWFLGQPLQNSLPAIYAPSARHGLLYGVMFFVSFGLGSVATSVGGWLVERHGTSTAFGAFGCVAAANLALVGLLAARARRRAGTFDRAESRVV